MRAEFNDELALKVFSQELDLDQEQILVELTALPALQLRSLLLSGGVSLAQVVKIFHLKKRMEANRHRALTDAFFEEPLAQALEIDDMTSYSKEQLPLLGFVLSLKDTILMRDTRSTWGLADNFQHFCRAETPFVEYLRSRGAVIMSKSNVPQLLASFDCANNVFGEASNPLDATRSPGGSSGGEAALVALGLSNLGVGTDGAGSLRAPALFCGLHALRVSAVRFDTSMISTPIEFREDAETGRNASLIIGSVVGPIARTVADLEAFARVFNDYNRVNRALPPVPWRKLAPKRRVGLLRELRLAEVPAVCRRAMNMCVSRLRDHDYELVELSLEEVEHDLLLHLFASLLQNELLLDLLLKRRPLGEPLMPHYASQASALGRSSCTLRLARGYLAPRKRLLADAVLLSRERNALYFHRRMAHYRRYFHELFARNDVDVALFYGLPPAFKKGTSGRCALLAAYLAVWNYLDFVAGALTVTRVRADEQFYESDHLDDVAEAVRDNMVDSRGLPVGVQVVGLPFCEERVLDLMKELEGDYLTRSETSSVIGDPDNKRLFAPL